jgi:hypothetical protein
MPTPNLRIYHKTLIATHIVIMAAIVFLSIGLFIVGKNINDAVSAVNETMTVVNRPRTGSIAGFNQTLFGVDALVKQTNGIVNHEDKQLTTLDAQELQFFNDFHSVAVKSGNTVSALGDTSKAATGTLDGLTAVLTTVNDPNTGIKPIMVSTNKTINDIDFYATDPHVRKFVDNLDPLSVNMVAITGNTAGITKNLDETTNDFQTKFHTWLYPVPCKTASCKWAKVFKFAVDASKFAEPFDFAAQGYEAIKK